MMIKRNVLIFFVLINITYCFGQKISSDTITMFSTYAYELKSDYIPVSILEMKNLTSLSIVGAECDVIIRDKNGKDISECWAIKEIPKEIGSLKKLQYLNLRLNAIRKIPENICELTRLRILDLTDNSGLENINNIVLLENLEELYVYGCNLTELPKNMYKMKNLKKLGLSGNNLEKKELDRIKNELPNCEIINI